MKFTLTLALAAIAATTAKAKPSLQFLGWSPKGILQECQGDCDYNKDCAKGLKCGERDDQKVRECSGKAESRADYCIIDPTQVQPSASVSKCGGTKAIFVTSLSSQAEWKSYNAA